MAEPLVTFQTASLAKENGFDLEVQRWYNAPPYEVKLLGSNDGVPMNFNYPNEHWPRVSAPSQTMLQKWLREKFRIHVEVNFNCLKERYDIQIWYRRHRWTDDTYYPNAATYELALEVGLLQGLKLIPELQPK